MSAFTDRFSATAKDPVSAFYKFLWTKFDATTILSPLIKVGNRIDFSDRDRGIKESIAAADCPEVMLTFSGISRRGFDSSQDMLTIHGQWTIATGELKFYNEVTYVTWLINVLMEKIERENCPDIDFEGVTIGNITIPDQMPLGFMDPAIVRGLKGFASKVNFQAELYYPRSFYDDNL